VNKLKFIENIKKAITQKMVQHTYMSNYGKPHWSTQKDEQYITEAYNKLVWIYSCVALISNCVSSVPWCLYRRRGKTITEIEDHPILNILNKQANPYLTSKDFFDMWATYLALQGKFYAKFNNSALPTQLEPLYPHYTNPIPDKRIFVSGYSYRIGGTEFIYDADEMMWSKFFDPLDMYQGLSPIKSMARTVDTENEAVDWNKNNLQNNAVPPGAFQVVNPSPELQSKLRQEWLSRYAGKNNVRVPLVLNAEKATYTSFGLSPIDMDFLEQRKLNRVEICAGFNVPSQLVGDPEGQTYANYKEAQKAFWENTIIPRYLRIIKDCLNKDLVIKYADNLYIEPNLDQIQALNEGMTEKAEKIRGLWKDGIITREESRNELGYETSEKDKVYYDETNLKDTDKEDEDEKEKDKDKDKKSLKKKIYY
jgi:HK97 family phage portal protein